MPCLTAKVAFIRVKGIYVMIIIYMYVMIIIFIMFLLKTEYIISCYFSICAFSFVAFVFTCILQ